MTKKHITSSFHSLYSNEDIYLIASNEHYIPLGKGIKKCIILVNDSNNNFIDQTNLTFLENILKAIDYSLDDISLINFHHYKISFQKIKEQYNPKHIILFDVNAFQLGIEDEHILQYESTQIENIQLISAESLTIIQNNIDKKKALWMALQRIFIN